MRTITYCRTSTTEQEISLDAQEIQTRKFAEAKGLTVVKVVREHASAKNTQRDGLTEVLRMLQTGEADSVTVSKLDRLVRTLRDLVGVLDSFKRWGVSLHSVGESIDTASPSGLLLLHVLGAVADWELATIRGRTKAAMAELKREGRRVGRVPYGFRLDDDGRHLVECQHEQNGLAMMKEFRAEGLPLRAISAELIANGFYPRTGKDRWDPSTLARILKRVDAALGVNVPASR